MKKLFSFMLTLVMLVACLSSTAFADELTPTVTVGTETKAVPVTDVRVIEKGEGLLRAPSQEYDLGSNGSISLSIANFEAGQVRVTQYKYKTNSTKIKVSMKSDISISVKVTLYDASNDAQLQQTTVTVGTLTYKTVTFSNLSSAKRYYMKFENLGQQEVNITGSISA